MIKTMSRGNQEDRVGSVEGRQVDQEQEEVEEVVEEEKMKMDDVEGSGNFGNESTENVSSGAIDGEISELSSIQKRTSACLNIAQAPNIAQAVSKGVDNDPKQAQTRQLTARGFIKALITRATSIIYDSMNFKKTNSIDTNVSTDRNAKLNIINNNINGVDNVTEKKENSISSSLPVNSIDSTIKIYEAGGLQTTDLVNNSISGSGVDSTTLGENNKLFNNSGCTNINDNNNNNNKTCEVNEENTPGEVKCENIILESVDSYPMNLQTEIPI
jgi:hypothetical protein